jgi:hypothetical protein
MAQAKRKPERKKRGRKTLVRGADGGLYLLTDTALAPFKIHKQKAEMLTKILEKAQKNPVPTKLSKRVIKDIEGIHTLWDYVQVSAETYINDIPRKE